MVARRRARGIGIRLVGSREYVPSGHVTLEHLIKIIEELVPVYKIAFIRTFKAMWGVEGVERFDECIFVFCFDDFAYSGLYVRDLRRTKARLQRHIESRGGLRAETTINKKMRGQS